MKKTLFLLPIFVFSLFILGSVEAKAVSLYLVPSQGTFFVGSSFSVSIYVNTKDEEINAVEVDLKFPPDILQITTPTAGKSFISEWLTFPSYSNMGGTISFKGGVIGGIATSAGLVSTINFRARSPGIAKIDFLDSSRVFLNNGEGTPVFATIQGGVFEVLVPPPEGPKVFSPTHLDPDVWYNNSSPGFSWERQEGVTDFSFSFSQNPQENPDTISEGETILRSYENIPDGIWYFHLRSKRGGFWGKASHFATRIDTTPPQRFEPKVEASRERIYFEAIDLHSGIDYYEISVSEINETPMDTSFFIEASSPFKIPSRQPGEYSVSIRAYDRAGNLREEEIRFRVMLPFLSYIEGRGIEMKGAFFSLRLGYVLFILIGGMGSAFYFLRRKRSREKRPREKREKETTIKNRWQEQEREIIDKDQEGTKKEGEI